MSCKKLAEICPKSPKAVQLCRAVCELLGEGVDIKEMKVSEITEKAGIGKGTAYEYFKSKEEMIAYALLYGVMENLKEVTYRVESCQSFRDKYLTILDWLEEIFFSHGSIAILCQVVTDSFQISGDLKRAMGKDMNGPEYVYDSIEELVQGEREAGELPDQMPLDLQVSLVISGFASFWIYQNRVKEPLKREIKEFFYQSLMRNLEAEWKIF